MTQPPLTRAIHKLEADLGVQLLERTSTGVAPTDPGEVLLAEAKMLLQQAERLEMSVRDAAGEPHLTIGSLADTADLVGSRLVAPFRRRHPHASVEIHEFDLTDPTAGLRTGAVDVALTRTPFDTTGLRIHTLAVQPIGVVVEEADPLGNAGPVLVDQLTDRRWVRLPKTSDPAWLAYWTGPRPDANRPKLRTIQECLQSVLWDKMTALAPLDQLLPPGLRAVPVLDRDPSRLVLAWRSTNKNPLVQSLVDATVMNFRSRGRSPARQSSANP